jgi:hypothetical protein
VREKPCLLCRRQTISCEDVKLGRAKACWATALVAVTLANCRFRYDQVELLSGDEGGGFTTGEQSFGNGSFGGASAAAGGAPETVNGGGGATGEGGTNGATATAGTSADGGTGSGEGGNGGTNGGPTLCVPDAICSCEVFAGRDYRFCSVLTVRDAGLAACESANMALIRIDSAEENAWLLQQFTDHGMFLGSGSSIVILGGLDTQVGTTWRWDDGTVFWDGAPVDNLYTNWSAPPKASQGNCLGMISDGKWVSRSCNSGNATVACESP